jgi:GNAT superfamily N-acetyltransferase
VVDGEGTEGGGGLVVRAAVEADLASVLVLFRHLHPEDPPLDPDTALMRWRALLAHRGTVVFLGWLGGTAVTSCTLNVIPNLTRNAAPYALVENVVTHADHRRKGYGSAVIRYALDVAWQRHCYKVMLMTGSKQDSTLRFYEGAGFRREKTAFVARP